MTDQTSRRSVRATLAEDLDGMPDPVGAESTLAAVALDLAELLDQNRTVQGAPSEYQTLAKTLLSLLGKIDGLHVERESEEDSEDDDLADPA